MIQYTTRDCATHWGVTLCRIRQIARARLIVPKRIGGVFVWTTKQRDAMKPGPPGWPKGRKRSE